MHTIKHVIENVVTFVGAKTDSAKVRYDQVRKGQLKSCVPEEGSLPNAPFILDDNEKALANRRARTVQFPLGTGSSIIVRDPVFANVFYISGMETCHAPEAHASKAIPLKDQ